MLDATDAPSRTQFTGSDRTMRILDTTGDASFSNQCGAEITNSSTWNDPLTSLSEGKTAPYNGSGLNDDIIYANSQDS